MPASTCSERASEREEARLVRICSPAGPREAYQRMLVRLGMLASDADLHVSGREQDLWTCPLLLPGASREAAVPSVSTSPSFVVVHSPIDLLDWST